MPNALTHRVWLWTIATVLLGAAVEGKSAETSPGSSARIETALTDVPSESVWLISTRHLGIWECEEEFRRDVEILRLDEHQDWRNATLSEFQESGESAAATVFYVHGNRFDWCDAVHYGLTVHERLKNSETCEGPIRYVIWSWPSDQIKGALRDVRIKAYRTNCESFYLASFLAQLDPSERVSLFGLSYGARIITGALHLLGGGTLCGMEIQVPPGRMPARVVLGAAALHNYWLLPGCFHGQAVSQMSDMLLLYNTCDYVLRRYRFLDRPNRPQALGYTGFPANQDPSTNAGRITQINACPYVGRSHSEMSYFCNPCLMETISRYLLWEQVD